MRVAAAVLLPDLARDLAETRSRATAFEGYLWRRNGPGLLDVKGGWG